MPSVSTAILAADLAAGGKAPQPALPSYDTVIVAFSGGKDSIACLLSLIEAGVPRERIELYHHDVDGQGPPFMDWPSTTAYCRAVARALGVPLYLSWKQGGFLREMLRENAPTAPIHFETPDGTVRTVGGFGPPGTRLRFPQVSANLNQRWCSAYLKIDVMAALVRAQERFLGRRTLIVTGERAQESRARAGYATFEQDRTDTRDGTRRQRLVDHWRPVHQLDEAAVWELIRKHGSSRHLRIGLAGPVFPVSAASSGHPRNGPASAPSRQPGSNGSQPTRTGSAEPSSAIAAFATLPSADTPISPPSPSPTSPVAPCGTNGTNLSG